MAPLGFARHGNLYRCDRDGGFVSLTVRKHSAYHGNIDFDVELEVCPAVALEWLLHERGLAPERSAKIDFGLMGTRIYRDASNGWLLSDASDGSACGQDLQNQVTSAVRHGLDLLDPDAMMRHLDEGRSSTDLRLQDFHARALLLAARGGPGTGRSRWRSWPTRTALTGRTTGRWPAGWKPDSERPETAGLHRFVDPVHRARQWIFL